MSLELSLVSLVLRVESLTMLLSGPLTCKFQPQKFGILVLTLKTPNNYPVTITTSQLEIQMMMVKHLNGIAEQMSNGPWLQNIIMALLLVSMSEQIVHCMKKDSPKLIFITTRLALCYDSLDQEERNIIM